MTARAHSYGCDYCSDAQNRLLGHLDQLCDESGGVVLLRCPLCASFYRFGNDLPRLTAAEADAVLPPSRRTVIAADR